MKILVIANLFRGFSAKTPQTHNKFFKELKTCDYDAVVVAGNLASSRRYHYKSCLKLLRSNLPDCPIMTVDGNHDFWDKNQKNLKSYLSIKQEWRKEYNIVYLPDHPLKIGDHLFVGVDGYQLEGKNIFHIPMKMQNGVPTQKFLADRQRFQMQRASNTINKHKAFKPSIVFVSHYFNQQEIDALPIKPGCVIFGNLRAEICELRDETLVACPGASFDSPKALILEV